MIKILHIADKLSVGDSTIHGVTRLFSWWFPLFNKGRYDVKLCVLRRRDSASDYLEQYVGDITYLGRGKFDPRTLLDLYYLVQRKQIDILHLHGYGSTTFGRLCGAFLKKPSIVHEHMVDINIPFYQRALDRLLSGQTKCAIAVSKSVKDFLILQRGIRHEKIEVIINGIPSNLYIHYTDKQHSDPISRLKIPSDHTIVSTIGRLHPIKGHIYLLEAAKIVLEKISNVSFLVIGDGDLLPTLKAKAEDLGIISNIFFLGHQDNIEPLLSNTDIVVIPSIIEGGPITLFEAMASQCAVISTNTIGLRDVIIDGETGFLVPPRDPEAISEKIILLIKDNDIQKDMVAKALERMVHYSAENTVLYLESIYKHILRHDGPFFQNITGDF